MSGGKRQGGAGGFACLAMLDYRRKLPHWQPDHVAVFLTWRLWGSLPVEKLIAKCAVSQTAGRAFAVADRALARQTSGPLWLSDARVAYSLGQVIRIGETERKFYELHAWAIMPNHVHLLILPRVPLPVITRWLKGSTDRKANLMLGRTGRAFWQDESFEPLGSKPEGVCPNRCLH